MNSQEERKNFNNTADLAKILKATDENIKKCADGIRNGQIIGMPTETVYGLAASAFDLEAVKKIFVYKGRPLSDPLIVHVTSVEMANKIINIEENTRILFGLLADKFWPGPLTIVLRANFDIISPILTANTNFIGIRFPNNEIAKKLIEYSGVPIAAPSANKFCHVSPVNPLHVYEDFKEFPVTILDGGVCNFCMESTVIKVVSENKVIQILRMGAISPDELRSFLKTIDQDYTVEIVKKNLDNKISDSDKNNTDKEHNNNNESLENQMKIDQEAPGQFIKHYSPQLDTYILDEDEEFNILDFKEITQKEVVFLDYMHVLDKKLREKFLFPVENFLQLSKISNPIEVMSNIYDYLRVAEKFPCAKIIVLCDLNRHMQDNEHKLTLVDRILKASAYKKINIK